MHIERTGIHIRTITPYHFHEFFTRYISAFVLQKMQKDTVFENSEFNFFTVTHQRVYIRMVLRIAKGVYILIVLWHEETHFIFNHGYQHIHIEWFGDIIRHAVAVSIDLIDILGFGGHHDYDILKAAISDSLTHIDTFFTG